MKARVYKGRIINGDIDYLNDHDGHHFKWNTFYYFTQVGENVGARTYGVYNLCDSHGEVKPEYERYQFSRSRGNHFWIEAID